MKLLDARGAQAAKDRRMADVAQSHERWIDRAAAIIHRIALRRAFLCCDDIWFEGLEPPKEPRALGPAFAWAARLGYIRSTGIHIYTIQVKRHRAPIRVWKSLLYGHGELFHQEELWSRSGAKANGAK